MTLAERDSTQGLMQSWYNFCQSQCF